MRCLLLLVSLAVSSYGLNESCVIHKHATAIAFSLFAQQQTDHATEAFQKLQSLAGDWKGKDELGNPFGEDDAAKLKDDTPPASDDKHP